MTDYRWDEGLIQTIGRALDLPSVYMSGASPNGRRKAAEVLDALEGQGYRIELHNDGPECDHDWYVSGGEKRCYNCTATEHIDGQVGES